MAFYIVRGNSFYTDRGKWYFYSFIYNISSTFSVVSFIVAFMKAAKYFV